MAALRTLPEALAAAARTSAGYCFVSNGVDRWRSYAEIRDASLRVSQSLLEAGLRRGDLVALVLPDGEQFLTALFGASLAGVTPASLYPPSATGELLRYVELTAAILRAAGARAVVTTRTLAPFFDRARGLCPVLSLVLCSDDLDATPLEPDVLPTLDDVAFVQFTSGSTSTPRGVALTHANVSANIEAFGGPSAVATTPDDIGVSWLPLNHDMGLVGMALGALYAGRPCVLLPPQAFVKRPVDWLRTIARHGGTVSFAPDFAYDLCVRRVNDLGGLDLSSWRVAGCGAEPIHPRTLAAFSEKFAAAGFRDSSFYPCYGLAEHVVAATVPPAGRRPRTEFISADEFSARRVAVPHVGEARPLSLVSCGSALPGHHLRIAGEDGQPLPDRHVGEILLAGPSVMQGYYNDRALTAETIVDGWLHTGDLGYVSDGELFVCGRAKDVIMIHGRNYHPQDLEWAIEGLAGVRRGRAVAFAARRTGGAEGVVIVVEPAGTVPPEPLTVAIRKEIADLFGLFVDDVVLVQSGTVGRTTSGKLQRAATRTRYERGEL
jgi:fatty-acyl-CoA synthase